MCVCVYVYITCTLYVYIAMKPSCIYITNRRMLIKDKDVVGLPHE